MNTKENPEDVQDRRGGGSPPGVEFTPSVLPAVQSPTDGKNLQRGVSTRNVPNRNLVKSSQETIDSQHLPHWYALRTTYGREKKAYDFIIAHGGTAFLPTITEEKVVNGKRKLVEVSRLPNIFFAYGTEEEIQSFVYDNVNLPYLRFYYKHTHVDSKIIKSPLIVPDVQIRSLQIICRSKNDVLFFTDEMHKYKKGEKVVITEGEFKGVEGVVARFQGQQRVGVVIDGLLTAITAYIPRAFLKKK